MPSKTEISNMEAFVEAMWLIAGITEVIGNEKRVSYLAVQPNLLSIHLIEKPDLNKSSKSGKEGGYSPLFSGLLHLYDYDY